MEERGICQQKGCLEISLELDKTENTNNRIIEKKMKIKKMMMAALAALMVPAAVWAQESDDNGVYAELNADLVSSYIWHGQDLGGISVQPSLTVGWKDLSLNVWGSAGIGNESHREMDLTLAYELGGFTFSVCDYWFLGSGETGKFFDYAAHSTLHTLEGSIGCDFDLFALTWSTYFAGADYNDEGKREYTSYIQADVPFTLAGFEGMATVGATPWGSTTYDANRFMVCEASVALSKEIKVTPTFSLNAMGKVVVNPATESTFFVFGLGF